MNTDHTLIISNGTLIDPSSKTECIAHIVIQNGKFLHIEKNPSELNSFEKKFTNAQIIDARGKLVLPGLVDLRARFREPGEEHKATIASEAYAAAKAGITSVCIPPDTDPIIDRPSVANSILEKSRLANAAKLYPVAALSQNLKGDMLGDLWTMTRAGCIGVSNARNSINSVLMQRRALQYAASFGVTVHLFPQDHELLGNGCVHEGLTSTRLGLPAIPSAAEIVGLARDIALIETTGVTAHIMGISCARSVEMIAQAQKNGLNITADVDIHHLLMNENDMRDFDSNFHIQPPLRTNNDQQALIQGIKSGVIQAVCSDHQPHDADAKLAPFSETEPGISSLDILLPGMLKISKEYDINLLQSLAPITTNPAKIAGLKAGEIAKNHAADCIIVNPNETWNLCSKTINSRGKNSPYLDQTLTGRCLQTIIDGRLIC